MVDQDGSVEVECVELAERAALQELEVSLLAALPFRDRLEGLNVTPDQLCNCRRALLDLEQKPTGRPALPRDAWPS